MLKRQMLNNIFYRIIQSPGGMGNITSCLHNMPPQKKTLLCHVWQPLPKHIQIPGLVHPLVSLTHFPCNTKGDTHTNIKQVRINWNQMGKSVTRLRLHCHCLLCQFGWDATSRASRENPGKPTANCLYPNLIWWKIRKWCCACVWANLKLSKKQEVPKKN